MRNIRERFDEISKDRKALRLREGDGPRRPDPSAYSQQQTSSHVLKEKVRVKRFLLVLDHDVWNEYRAPWDSLKAPLVDAGIVRIIATTILGTIRQLRSCRLCLILIDRLGCLSHDHCWSLFQLHAFGGRCSEHYSNLVEIGHQFIISKCGVYYTMSSTKMDGWIDGGTRKRVVGFGSN